MSGKEVVQEIIHSPKVAAGVSAVTTGTGAGTILEWIPDDIGKLATLVGIILSVILIRVHLIGLKKLQLEYKIMKDEDSARESNEEAHSDGSILNK